MKALIEVRMDNAAFEDMPGMELGRILRDLAKHVEHADGKIRSQDGRRLMDSNGNHVGCLHITVQMD